MAAQNERFRGWLNDDRALDLLDTLEQVSLERGTTMTATALAWMLTNPTVSSAIVGANTPAQLHDSLAAIGRRLTADEKAALDAASTWS